jgi:hypothetical protein
MKGTQSGTIVELHWAFFPHYASFDVPVSEANDDSVNVEIAGYTLKTLDLRHLALILGAHGSKHSWSRLGWLVDFALVLQSSADDADRLLEVAAEKGIRRILLISAALARKVLQLMLPVAFENAIAADLAAQVLANKMEEALLAGVMPEDGLSENLSLLRSRERWSDRLKIVSRLAFTPGPEEWGWVVLPEWAGWLYHPMRIARASRHLPRIAQRAFLWKKR